MIYWLLCLIGKIKSGCKQWRALGCFSTFKTKQEKVVVLLILQVFLTFQNTHYHIIVSNYVTIHPSPPEVWELAHQQATPTASPRLSHL